MINVFLIKAKKTPRVYSSYIMLPISYWRTANYKTWASLPLTPIHKPLKCNKQSPEGIISVECDCSRGGQFALGLRRPLRELHPVRSLVCRTWFLRVPV